MSLRNTSKIKKHAYTYLGYRNMPHDERTDKIIDECIEEIERIAQFKYIYAEFDYQLDFLKDNAVYQRFLKDTTSYYLVLTTLGKKVDDKCRYYSKIDMEKMVIFDAVSSAYLEYMADEFEEENFPKDRTYRFCPGYQGTETKDIREIFKYINPLKCGVELLESNLMVPMKSMCGIVGVGKNKKLSCGNCVVKEKCEYRKEGTTCYQDSEKK